MSLQQQIIDDVKQAMKQREAEKLSVLRMVHSAIKNTLIDHDGDELSDQDVIRIIKKEIKQKQESLEQYKEAGREDSVQLEQQQIAFLEEYLPEELSLDAVEGIVNEAIASTNASSMADMGTVMKEVMPKIQGQFDGSKVQQLVQEKLQ